MALQIKFIRACETQILPTEWKFAFLGIFGAKKKKIEKGLLGGLFIILLQTFWDQISGIWNFGFLEFCPQLFTETCRNDFPIYFPENCKKDEKPENNEKTTSTSF